MPTYTDLGTVTLSPPGVALVCSGGQLELVCTTAGSFLEWRFRIFLENETTATDTSRVIRSASAAVSLLMVNSTLFNFSRISARDSLPVKSTLVIGPVSDNLSGTLVNCLDLRSSQNLSTTVVIIKKDSSSLPGMNYSYVFLNFVSVCKYVIQLFL